MSRDKTRSHAHASPRGEPVRQRVLDAAERLLRQGKAGFSMRDLAAEAGVSFATPFNQFGSKAAIMLALSGRRIDLMIRRLAEAPPPVRATDRVMLAIDTAVAVMLAEPEVNRAVMGWIGAASATPGHVLTHSTALWASALAAGDDAVLEEQIGKQGGLAEQLAFAFRGVLSFWAARELEDEELAPRARAIAASLLLGCPGAQPVPGPGSREPDNG
ncbi:TetR/AcrR family transcriptional regulator [Sphingomonas quercus]|uniref:TetR/AcrR family transcriptional regulator n=1 Tax=Sphingomonas quercus TaxID=2842451 RepID=A0ABS6BHR7_9SPHN|nr:TetR/AcrR family transcriptional regulator [Sphingomonas quercus]MBU3077853.1 TetR/AcrR family transcriptional regulator [Sphingomonas quercus]